MRRLLILLLFSFDLALAQYGGYGASMGGRQPNKSNGMTPRRINPVPEDDNRYYEFWSENKPRQDIRNIVGFGQPRSSSVTTSDFVDDNSFVTDPPGIDGPPGSLPRTNPHTNTHLIKSGGSRNFKPEGPPAFNPSAREERLIDSKPLNENSKSTVVKKKLTKSEERLLKEIEAEIEEEETTKAKKINKIESDPEGREVQSLVPNRKISEKEPFNEVDQSKLPVAALVPDSEAAKETALKEKIELSNGDLFDKSGTTSTNKGKPFTQTSSPRNTHSLGPNHHESIETVGGRLAPGTQPDPFTNLPKLSAKANPYAPGEDTSEEEDENTKTEKYLIIKQEVKGDKYKTESNQGTDYMDDLDHLHQGEGKTLAPYGEKATTKAFTYQEHSKSGTPQPDILITNDDTTNDEKLNGKTTDIPDDGDFFKETGGHSSGEHSSHKSSTNSNDGSTSERKSTSRPDDSRKNCCACCDKKETNLVKTTSTSYRPDLKSYGSPPGFVGVPELQQREDYIPTGRELAARYGVPYASLTGPPRNVGGFGCGQPQCLQIQIPYIPPPCCIQPLVMCCLPTIPCCPKIQVTCCPQQPICCQPRPITYANSAPTTCGGCRNGFMTRLRTKRNNCTPCGRAKRSALMDGIESDDDLHVRSKRFGCLPCLAKQRVKRSPGQGNCSKCSGHAFERFKRNINHRSDVKSNSKKFSNLDPDITSNYDDDDNTHVPNRRPPNNQGDGKAFKDSHGKRRFDNDYKNRLGAGTKDTVYKITVKGAKGASIHEVLLQIQTHVESCIPYNPTKNDKGELLFFVKTESLANDISSMNRRIKNPRTNESMSFITLKTSSTWNKLGPGHRDLIEEICRSRLLVETKTLDLHDFAADKLLKQKSVMLSLGRIEVAIAVVDWIFQNCRDIECLSLRSCAIKNLIGIQSLVYAASNIRVLDLSCNSLENLNELIKIKPWRLTEIYLENTGAASAFTDPSQYARAVQVFFPHLVMLDGSGVQALDIPASSTESAALIIRPSFFPTPAIQEIIENFFTQYVSCFDGPEPDKTRKMLMEAYDESAIFSLVAEIIDDHTSNRSDNREALRTEMSHYRTTSHNIIFEEKWRNFRTRTYAKGNLEILTALCRLPATTHLRTSFIYDVGLTTEKLVQFKVHGLLNDNKAAQGPNGNLFKKGLRYFTRSFAVLPRAEARLSIISDIMTIYPITEKCSTLYGDYLSQINKVQVVENNVGADGGTVSSLVSSMGISATSSTIPQDEESMMRAKVHEFSKLSGMNFDWSKKCLEESGWDFQTAGKAFTEHKDNIPKEAFIM
uniref:TAP-C domain-containing protein n=1 Tax=Rhabditophanes sp. KR3021 TaxID=114890 RepID=A0AC35TUQ3_9BILA